MTDTKVNNMSKESFRRQKSREEMQKQLISFGLMIVLTLVAFAVVAMDTFHKGFVIPFLFLMAIVQAGFQFYYFMHLKERGTGMAALLIYGGVWAAFLTLAGLILISWW